MAPYRSPVLLLMPPSPAESGRLAERSSQGPRPRADDSELPAAAAASIVVLDPTRTTAAPTLAGAR